jgi:purine-binding chemotaxis protein CheW
MSAPNSTDSSYCTFRLGKLNLGIEVASVQEVIRHQPTTRVPLANGDVQGLINLRGQIVVALDLKSKLGVPSDESDSPPMNVVVRSPDGPVSLLVDEIGDVVEGKQTQVEKPPKSMSEAHRKFIRGALKLDEGLLLLLDTEEVLLSAAS